MFWKLTDSSYYEGECRRNAYINPAFIEAITVTKESTDKIKVHLVCGKEFRADKDCLLDLGEILNMNKLLL